MQSRALTAAARPSGIGPPESGFPGVATVHLLGRFAVSQAGATVELPASTQRLIAFLALEGRPVERGYAAGCLWLDKSGDRANANLRSTLWRLRRCSVQLVTVTASDVRLSDGVQVDSATMLARARDLVDERRPVDLDAVDVQDLSADLLPSWYDDFVEVERERFRQLRLHALEALSRRLAAEGRHARALDAALAAVSADPLRESAHRAVMQVHLAEGNTAEAVRQYRLLTQVLKVHLGIPPSRRSGALIGVQLTEAEPPTEPARGEVRPGRAAAPAPPARSRAGMILRLT